MPEVWDALVVMAANCRKDSIMAEKGILYGVSIGPGDPELLTVQTIRLLRRVPVIAYPIAKTGSSMTIEIISEFVDIADKELIRMSYSSEPDRKRQLQLQEKYADEMRIYLEDGKDVAMLNVGDLSIYSTFFVFQELLARDGFSSRLLPGVTSFCAIAARLGISLTNEDEPLIIAADTKDLDQILAVPGTKVFMKSGSEMPAVIRSLAKAGLLERSAMITNCGLKDERIYANLTDFDPDQTESYFSTVIVT